MYLPYLFSNVLTLTSSPISHLPSIFTHTIRYAKVVPRKDWIPFWKIHVGDQVKVMSGTNRGVTGKVMQCLYTRNHVRVEGCRKGFIKVKENKNYMERSVHYSNVKLIDPLTHLPTRIALKFDAQNKPVRISKATGAIIPWPDQEDLSSSFEEVEGPKDTPPEKALEKSYNYIEDTQEMRKIRQTMPKYNRELK